MGDGQICYKCCLITTTNEIPGSDKWTGDRGKCHDRCGDTCFEYEGGCRCWDNFCASKRPPFCNSVATCYAGILCNWWSWALIIPTALICGISCFPLLIAIVQFSWCFQMNC